MPSRYLGHVDSVLFVVGARVALCHEQVEPVLGAQKPGHTLFKLFWEDSDAPDIDIKAGY